MEEVGADLPEEVSEEVYGKKRSAENVSERKKMCLAAKGLLLLRKKAPLFFANALLSMCDLVRSGTATLPEKFGAVWPDLVRPVFSLFGKNFGWVL